MRKAFSGPLGLVRLFFFFLWAAAGYDLGAAGSQEITATPPPGIRIATYNLENYLPMTRRINGQNRSLAGKPESEKAGVVRMIETVRPDIIGLMEIGDPSQFEDLRRRLRKSGIDLPFTEYLQASDPMRHVALLSRYPIVERHSLGELLLQVNGITLHSPRGILDVTVEPSPGARLRILCVHLKAKLEIAEYDEAGLREAESQYLRKYVREILGCDPETRLVLMGDFNDTKNEKVIRHILGKPDWPDSLTALQATDDRGEYWTEYWAAADVYSRIDYIMVSKKLEREIDSSRSGIARPPFWNQASDHCPVYMTISNSSTATP